MNNRALIVLTVAMGLAACGERASSSDGALDPRDSRGLDMGWSDLPRVDAAPRDLGLPDKPCSCNLAITKINGKPFSAASTLSVGDTITVELVAPCLRDGTVVTVTVTGYTSKLTAALSGGKAIFPGLNIDDVATLRISTDVPGCSDLLYGVIKSPACTIVYPPHGSTLTTPPSEVKVATTNAFNGTVILRVNSAVQGTPQNPDPFGVVTFKSISISTGVTTLQAEVTVAMVTRICQSTVTVPPPPKCVLTVSPPPTSTIKGDGFNTLSVSFAVATNPGVTSVVLKELMGTLTWTVTPASGVASYSGLSIPEGQRELQATCTNATTGAWATSAKASFIVDLTPPPAIADLACSLTASSTGDVTCTFKGVSDGAAGIGVEHYLLSYTSSSGTTATTKVPPNAPGVSHTATLKGLPSGSHSFNVRAVDYLGNTATASNQPSAITIP
jgi:hypothetical protein